MKLILYKLYFWFLKLFAKKEQVKELQAEILAEMMIVKPGIVIKDRNKSRGSWKKIERYC